MLKVKLSCTLQTLNYDFQAVTRVVGLEILVDVAKKYSERSKCNFVILFDDTKVEIGSTVDLLCERSDRSFFYIVP